MDLFLALLGLHCCTGVLWLQERGRSLAALRGLLIVGLLLLRGARTSVAVALGLWSADSGAGAHGLSCSAVCGVLPDQGSSPWLLPWQVDSLPPSPQGRPCSSRSEGLKLG